MPRILTLARSLRLAAFLAVLAPAVTAAAQTRPVTKLDPNVLRAVRTGVVGPMHNQRPAVGRATVLLDLDRRVDDAVIADIEATGAQVARVEGKPLVYEHLAVADVDEPSAVRLSVHPMVRRIQLASTRGPMPLDHSAELVRLADGRGARPALDLMTGKDIVVGDVDSNVDLFHPTFFRGDAGYYDWIDVDGDGVFTPGVDAIDLNGNGMPDPGEIAQAINAATVDFYGMPVAARGKAWDPSTDWVYLDTNGNNKRDYGAPKFDDTVPAFGEPLFVPDDVNKNGRIDVGERFVRLGTSKFRDIYVHLDYGFNVDSVYHRNKDLSGFPVDVTHGKLYSYPDALHATGVLTIVAGDVPLVGRKWVGFVPDADLVLSWDVEQTGEGLPLKGATWVVNEKPDVMLYELAPWTGSALDGTDALSKIIDASSDADHITHTCPTGDQGSALKHAHADVAAAAVSSLPFDLPTKDKAGDGPLTYVEVSVNVRGGTLADIVLTEPDGTTNYDLLATANVGGNLSTGAEFYPTEQVTERGTQFIDVILYAQTTSTPLPTGTWTVTSTAGTADVTVDAYVMDDKSTWAVGAAWDPSIATDTSTIGIPSVADHCIAVGAHPNHVAAKGEPWYDVYYAVYDVPGGFTETQGQVRAYSPLGPRIDLVQKPDVLAPDNPWVASQHEVGSSSTNPYGSFFVFGGTSGASPHVTGTAALLAQAGIRADDARDAIRKGAVHDSVTGPVWNKSYGYGRLDTAGALGVTATSGPPTVTLTYSPSNPEPGDMVTLVPTAKAADGKTSGLQVKWDDDYDGTWDTPYGPVEPRKVTSDKPQNRPFKVRVRDEGGHIAEAVAWVDFEVNSGSGGSGGGMLPHDNITDSGCGCRVDGDGSGAPAALGLTFLALFGMRRRRAVRR